MNYNVLFFLQVIVFGSNARYVVTLANMDCPPPKVGNSGEMNSISIVVNEFHRSMSNMYTNGVKLKERSTHTLYNNGTIYALRNGVKAVFNGRQVCISVKKESILDQSGSNETILQQCLHKCFAFNETVVQVTRVEEGGTLLAKKLRGLCCVWSSVTSLEISMQKPSYKCLACSGDECQKNSTKVSQCSPGVGCFSMVFTMKIANKLMIYRMKGCTNNRMLFGRGCWNGCKKMAVNYNMCIECCFGDRCNANQERSTVTPTKLSGRKMWRVASGSKRNLHSAPELLFFLVFTGLLIVVRLS